MVAYLKFAPNGVPGSISRVDESSVEPAMLVAQSSVYAQAFGIPLKYVTGGVAQFTGGETAADFAAILVREAPSESGNALSGFTDTIPNPEQVQGILVRGYCAVKVAAGTPARGGIVYVQVVANGGVAVGDYRADGTDSGNAVALSTTQATWASDGVDSDGNGEIRVAR